VKTHRNKDDELVVDSAEVISIRSLLPIFCGGQDVTKE